MTQQEIEALRTALLSSKRVKSDAGEVEERSIDELKKVMALLGMLDQQESKRPALSRVGRYRRRYPDA